jgi:chemotaxis response regulator CheB
MKRASPSKVTVVLAIGDSLLRCRLRDLMDQDPRFDVIGESVDGNEAVALTKRLKPAMVVLDEELAELDGPEAARRILKDVPRTQLFYLGRGPDEGEPSQPWAPFKLMKDLLPDDAVELMKRQLKTV